MASQIPSVKYALSRLEQHDNTPLKLHFTDTTVTKPGATLTRSAGAEQPSISVNSSVVKLDPSKRHLIVALDLDPPYPATPFLGPLLHLIHADLQLGKPVEGWTKLESPSEAKPVVSYAPPTPPPFSSAHRYLFMLFEQPAGVDSKEIQHRMRLPAEVGLQARIRWNQAGFEKEMGLGMPLAGTFFRCS
jgi:phosphatidylethanolamine-binding protein